MKDLGVDMGSGNMEQRVFHIDRCIPVFGVLCSMFYALRHMRLITWNVNGIRSLEKNGNWDAFFELDPDIFFLQETKAEESQLSERLRNVAGYHAYFSSSRERKGYSGVAMYSKIKPDSIEIDVLPDIFNTEGRLIEAVFGDVVMYGVYFPNGGRGEERIQYKLGYYDAFLERIEKMRKSGKSIIFCGDINTAHHEIDLARPKENQQTSGFLPEEREWLDSVENTGYVDVYRHFYPTKTGAYTYWDTITRARERNVGWRLDYFFVSPDLISKVKGCEIATEIYGSDHCPVVLDIEL